MRSRGSARQLTLAAWSWWSSRFCNEERVGADVLELEGTEADVQMFALLRFAVALTAEQLSQLGTYIERRTILGMRFWALAAPGSSSSSRRVTFGFFHRFHVHELVDHGVTPWTTCYTTNDRFPSLHPALRKAQDRRAAMGHGTRRVIIVWVWVKDGVKYNLG